MKVCWKQIFGQVLVYITMEGICSWWHSYSWPSLSNHQWIFIFCQKEGESSQNPRSKTGYFFCFPSEQLVPKCWWLSALLCSQSLFHLELIQYFEVSWGSCLLIGGIGDRVCQNGRGPLREAQCWKRCLTLGNACLFTFLGAGFTIHFPHFPSSFYPPFPPFISRGLFVKFVQYALFQLLTIAQVNGLSLMRLLLARKWMLINFCGLVAPLASCSVQLTQAWRELSDTRRKL